MDLLKREDWIEVDRRKVIAVNGTLYSRVPEYLKRAGIKAGYEVVYLRATGFPHTIIEHHSEGDPSRPN